jgi:hypothetical protein
MLGIYSLKRLIRCQMRGHRIPARIPTTDKCKREIERDEREIEREIERVKRERDEREKRDKEIADLIEQFR